VVLIAVKGSYNCRHLVAVAMRTIRGGFNV